MLWGSKPTTDPIAEALNEATISAWNFDEWSGTTAFNEKGSNDWTLVNSPTWTTWKIWEALDYNWSNQYTSLWTWPDFRGTSNEMSFNFWFTTDTPATEQRCSFHKESKYLHRQCHYIHNNITTCEKTDVMYIKILTTHKPKISTTYLASCYIHNNVTNIPQERLIGLDRHNTYIASSFSKNINHLPLL
jgi:hypothetical protein